MGDGRPNLELDGASVDLAQGVLSRGDAIERLSTKEVEVLRYLAENPSRPISHEELLENVWGHSRLASTQPVYSVMKRLRRKVDGHGEHRHIVSVHGVGYRFELPSRPPHAPPSASIPRASWARLTSFVGRDAELARTEDALARGARLVSLVGPGGAGKTRSALELAERAARRGSDVVFCDLSDARTADDLVRVVATQVGARREEAGAPPIESALRARGTSLLVLDNVEQVVEHAACEALRWAEITPLLVTSRERLAVPGEHVVSIGPLEPSDAAELFRERCRMAGLEVEPGDERIVRIVDRLDRLPLAIELAASRAGSVALSSLAESLERPTLAMTPTMRGRHARHATLRASVEWSWALLSDAERTFLARCSAFVGGFTEHAATQVVGIDDAASILQRLIERSLVRRETSNHGAPRLRLYETVRELASERLDDGGDTFRRHADWALGLARDVGALRIVSPPDAYSRLAPESENLLAAFRRTIGTEPQIAGELALALELVLRRGATVRESQEVLSAASLATRGPLRVRVRLALGRTHQQLGERGRALLEETVALAEAERLTDPGLVVEAERLLAACRTAMGEPGLALPRLEAVYRRTDLPPVFRGRAALELGVIHRLAAGLARARDLLSEAEGALEAEGDLGEAARAAFALSHVSREEGAYARALADLERARTYLEECGDEVGLAGLEVERGILLVSSSQVDEARAALGAGAIAHRRLGLPASELRARDWLVLALLGGGRVAEARIEIAELRRLGRELGRAVYEPERALGAVLVTEGQYAQADEVLTRTLALLEAGGEATVRGHVLSLRGHGRVLMDRLGEAEVDMRESAAIHSERGRSTAAVRSVAMLAIVRELVAPRDDTDEVLAVADALTRGRPFDDPDAKQGRLRHAIVAVTRARRAGTEALTARAIADEARKGVLGPNGEAPDWLTQCSLMLLDHALVRRI